MSLDSIRLPSALRAAARWLRLGDRSHIPAMLVHPEWDVAKPPVILWMHGRTVTKELDPGRYLRWLRAGFAACAVDLPGHGERFDAHLQQASQTLAVVNQMRDEIDQITRDLDQMNQFDMTTIGIGGMSAGGMAAISRLCQPHAFACASVEATTGSWLHQRDRAMFKGMSDDQINQANPLMHLRGWRNIPFQAIHAQHDEWVPLQGQAEFIDALQQRTEAPDMIEFIVYEKTGAPNEHAGFGNKAADAKDRQLAFFQRWLSTQSSR